MSCNCISKFTKIETYDSSNVSVKKKDRITRLTIPVKFPFVKQNGIERLGMATFSEVIFRDMYDKKVDSLVIIHTYCPFCGKKHNEDQPEETPSNPA